MLEFHYRTPAMLLVLCALACATQVKKNPRRSNPPPTDLSGETVAEDSLELPPDANSVMAAIAKAADEGQRELTIEARKPEATPQQAKVLSGAAAGMGEVKDVTIFIASQPGPVVGEACAGSKAAVAQLGGDLEPLDPRKSLDWLGWMLVGGALAAAGVTFEETGVLRMNEALRNSGIIGHADVNVVRTAMIADGVAGVKRVIGNPLLADEVVAPVVSKANSRFNRFLTGFSGKKSLVAIGFGAAFFMHGVYRLGDSYGLGLAESDFDLTDGQEDVLGDAIARVAVAASRCGRRQPGE